MLFKLAVRNVRRQFSSYIVYFVTVMITVALMFSAVNMSISSPLFRAPSDQTTVVEDMQSTGIILGMVIVSSVISLIISRAQIFIIGIRKRELGTYKLLGLKNRDIIKLFTLETGIIYVFTLICGIITGLFFYQGLNTVILRWLDIKYEISGYSLRAFVITCLLALMLFTVSALSSAEYLKKTDINELVNNRRKKVKKLNKESFKLSLVICILSLLVQILVSAVCINPDFLTDEKYTGRLAELIGISSDTLDTVIFPVVTGVMILIVPAAVLLFNMSYPRCIVHVLLKNKKISSRGTNKFLLRQLSSKSSSNSSMYGALAIILTIVLCILSVLSSYRTMIGSIYDDCNMEILDGTYAGEFENIINKYTTIEKKATEKKIIIRNSVKPEAFKGVVTASVIPYSSALELMSFNDEKFELKEGTYVIARNSRSDHPPVGQSDLVYKDLDLKYAGEIETDSMNYDFIIPDSSFKSLMDNCSDKEIMVMERVKYVFGKKYDVYEMNADFEKNGIDSQYIMWYDMLIRNTIYESAPVIILLLFMALSFIIMSMAMIGLKASSEVSSDRERFQKLYQTGVNKKILCRTLMKQTAVIFIIPFVQPLIFSYFFSIMEGKLINDATSVESSNFSGFVFTAVTVGIIYLAYFTVTYSFLKKKEISEKEQRKIL